MGAHARFQSMDGGNANPSKDKFNKSFRLTNNAEKFGDGSTSKDFESWKRLV